MNPETCLLTLRFHFPHQDIYIAHHTLKGHLPFLESLILCVRQGKGQKLSFVSMSVITHSLIHLVDDVEHN